MARNFNRQQIKSIRIAFEVCRFIAFERLVNVNELVKLNYKTSHLLNIIY